MREKSRISIFYFLLVFSLAGVVFLSCKGEEEEPVNQEDLESIVIRPEVVFTEVDEEPIRFYIESRGVVEPLQKIQITPRIAGFVEQHNLVEGKLVNKGDLLLKLNDDEWTYLKEQAYNEYIKAKNEYEIESRLRNQSTNGDTSNGDELVRITTGLAEAELAYERAKLDLSYATLNAPFSGRISTKEVITNGAYISTGQDLGTLIDASKVRIRFDVLESEITSLEEGMTVELEDPSGKSHEGEIIAISPEIDPKSKTGQALVEVNNPDGALKVGMTVEGRVFVRSISGKVRMPREALLERDGRTLVFKLHNKEVEWIYVTPEAMNGEWVLINHPDIFPGDTLAVDQHFSISHQQKVIPLMTN